MSNYQKKIAPGIAKIENALFNLDGSDNWVNNEIWNAREGIRMIENPFGTVPAKRYIHITTSFCDIEGNSNKAHSDSIDFNREISAALLYTYLRDHMNAYESDPYCEIEKTKYVLQNPIGELEDWLNQQKGLYQTTGIDWELIEDTGLTIVDYETKFGSIDVFIEFGIHHNEEL